MSEFPHPRDRDAQSSVAHELLDEWDLRPDGPVRSGEAGSVWTVRRADGSAAALKVQASGPETDAAILGLTHWDGRGAVRLLASDAERGAMLLERLHADQSLHGVEDDDEAVRVVGELLALLHDTAAPDGLPRLETIVAEMLDHASSAAPLVDRHDRALMHRWTRMVAEVAPEPGRHLLHWDLHNGNVLAGDRAPWLAIDPEPLVGDPGFDLWPALDSGWSADGSTVGAGRVVRRRFDILTEMLDIDRARATAWTAARLLQNALWNIEDGQPAISQAARVVDAALPRNA